MKEINILSLFDYSGKIKQGFLNRGFNCISLDINQNKKNNNVDIVCDFMEWDYKQYSPGYFNFIFIAFPCFTFSRESGGFHFKGNIPKTIAAHNSISMLMKLKCVLDYFNCPFMLENPTSAIGNSHYFKILGNLNYSRITQSNFGFPTRKQTDFFYNFNMLMIVPVTYRKNGLLSKKSLDNMKYRDRVTYPDQLVNFLIENILLYFNFFR